MTLSPLEHVNVFNCDWIVGAVEHQICSEPLYCTWCERFHSYVLYMKQSKPGLQANIIESAQAELNTIYINLYMLCGYIYLSILHAFTVQS